MAGASGVVANGEIMEFVQTMADLTDTVGNGAVAAVVAEITGVVADVEGFHGTAGEVLCRRIGGGDRFHDSFDVAGSGGMSGGVGDLAVSAVGVSPRWRRRGG